MRQKHVMLSLLDILHEFLSWKIIVSRQAFNEFVVGYRELATR